MNASYVLDWLQQTDAPENIIQLQGRVVEVLGGYVGHEDYWANWEHDGLLMELWWDAYERERAEVERHIRLSVCA